MMVGFVDPDEDPNSIPLPAAAQASDDDDDAEVEDTGPDPEEAEETIHQAIERAFNRAMNCIAKDDVRGYERNMNRAAVKRLDGNQAVAAVHRQAHRANLKDIINRIRSQRTHHSDDICVKQAKHACRARPFIETFKANETNLNWINRIT